MHKARLLLRPLRRGRSAELSRYESADPSTELLRFPGIFGLGEHSHDGFRAGRTNNDPARAAELCIEALNLLKQVVREVLCGDSHILFRLWKTRQNSCGLGEGAALERRAEEQRGRETVARDVILQVDDVTRLLATEHPALAAERLQHVAVSDVGRDQANTPLLREAVEAVVRHHRHGHEIAAEVLGKA